MVMQQKKKYICATKQQISQKCPSTSTTLKPSRLLSTSMLQPAISSLLSSRARSTRKLMSRGAPTASKLNPLFNELLTLPQMVAELSLRASLREMSGAAMLLTPIDKHHLAHKVFPLWSFLKALMRSTKLTTWSNLVTMTSWICSWMSEASI